MTSNKKPDIDKELFSMNLYDLLKISIDASQKQIKRAYLKKALECHPDKNPDDSEAAKKFHRLSQIYEILANEHARIAYDKVLKAREAAHLRDLHLNEKRRKFKHDLDSRENQTRLEDEESQENMEEVIRLLREDGLKMMQEEFEAMSKELEKETLKNCQLKVRWNKGNDYSSEQLYTIFSKYGDVDIVVSKRKPSAVVEFVDSEVAGMALRIETGLLGKPIKLERLGMTANVGCKRKNTESTPGVVSDRDFESVVMMNMRRAAERKKIIKEMAELEQQDTSSDP